MNHKERIHTLDELRGFCVFCMVFDHGLYTYGYMFNNKFSRELFDWLAYISPAFAAAFVIICGISCMLSHSNLMRGLKISAAAIAVTSVSLIIMPDSPIIFGILHMLGVCILLYSVAGKLTDKIPASLGISLCALLFLLTFNIENGYLGVSALRISIPLELYTSNHLMILGLISPYQSYSDYFPLLPWLFAFFAGIFIGRYAKEERFPKFMYKPRIPFFSLLGKNAFFVYLIHQPLAWGVFYIISLI